MSFDIMKCPSAKMQIARHVDGHAIGVGLTLLITTDQVKYLPDMYKKMAEGLLYEEATKKA